MKAIPNQIFPDVKLIQLTSFKDDRGQFMETYHQENLKNVVSIPHLFKTIKVFPIKCVLRGLHFQISPFQQAKYIEVLAGHILDVVVDIRPESNMFGQWASYELKQGNPEGLYIPGGFAHGFYTLVDHTVIRYKCSHKYSKEHERCLRWSDPDINISWPFTGSPLLSPKDAQGLTLKALFT